MLSCVLSVVSCLLIEGGVMLSCCVVVVMLFCWISRVKNVRFENGFILIWLFKVIVKFFMVYLFFGGMGLGLLVRLLDWL